ncbi:hypothetical protein [Blastococcus aggregatus]
MRRLARSGALRAQRFGRTLMFDPHDVDARTRLLIHTGRTWAPWTAWAALWELSGERADWLDASTRSRLRARLRACTADQLLAAVRGRAMRYDLAPSHNDQNKLGAAWLVLSGQTAARLAGVYVSAERPAPRHSIEGYCVASRLQETLGWFRLPLPHQPDRTMEVIVRVPRFDGLPLRPRHRMPVAVIGVDLAESRDAGVRQAGLKVLTDALGALSR